MDEDSEKCGNWAYIGYCHSDQHWHDWMLNHCPDSCGICGSGKYSYGHSLTYGYLISHMKMRSL